MLKTVAMCAALLALLAAWLPGIPLCPLLGRVRGLRLPLRRPDPTPAAGFIGADAPSDAAPRPQQPAPLLGGLLLWLGLGLGFVVSLVLASPTLTAGGYYRGWRTAATLLGCAGIFGLIGLLEDCLRLAHRCLSPWLRLLLQLGAAALFLAQLALNGGFTGLLCLPGLGWVRLGGWYYAVAALLVLGVTGSLRPSEEADGPTAGAGFMALLTFLVLALLLLEPDIPGDSFVTALFAAAGAGACAGFLFWNYPPARLRLGGAGSGLLAGALIAMAWQLGRPELLVPVCLPFWLDGAATLAARRPFGGLCARQRLAAAGWQPPTVLALFCGLGCLGGVLAILSVFLYG